MPDAVECKSARNTPLSLNVEAFDNSQRISIGAGGPIGADQPSG